MGPSPGSSSPTTSAPAISSSPRGRFYESKSYPTFTPIGPRLVLLDRGDIGMLDRLRLRLWVNNELRQDQTLADMMVRPARALALLRFQTLQPGDARLTGTPGGTALKAPPTIVERISALLPPALKRRLFFAGRPGTPAS